MEPSIFGHPSGWRNHGRAENHTSSASHTDFHSSAASEMVPAMHLSHTTKQSSLHPMVQAPAPSSVMNICQRLPKLNQTAMHPALQRSSGTYGHSRAMRTSSSTGNVSSNGGVNSSCTSNDEQLQQHQHQQQQQQQQAMSHSVSDQSDMLTQLYGTTATRCTPYSGSLSIMSGDGSGGISTPQPHMGGFLDNNTVSNLGNVSNPLGFLYSQDDQFNEMHMVLQHDPCHKSQSFPLDSARGGAAGGQENTLQYLNPVMVNGVVVGFEMAPQPLTPAMTPAPIASTASLYVKNLPPETTELTLYQRFSAYGALLSCKVPADQSTGKCRGVGFVNFVERDCAIRALHALHGLRLGEGRHMHITLQAPRAVRAAVAVAAHQRQDSMIMAGAAPPLSAGASLVGWPPACSGPPLGVHMVHVAPGGMGGGQMGHGAQGGPMGGHGVQGGSMGGHGPHGGSMGGHGGFGVATPTAGHGTGMRMVMTSSPHVML